ncbi:unnamed protein product [Notodromas monacha]|uniref:Uncharacterized protein n=1 Tax=Notodromas monacha TaxID=399045 RepID=A0A7R9BDE0_9CRUS|nr:unnamed protein product [Notodromas monacha]CAG0913263.1 unnamed protein product [Notodromas monacha]
MDLVTINNHRKKKSNLFSPDLAQTFVIIVACAGVVLIIYSNTDSKFPRSATEARRKHPQNKVVASSSDKLHQKDLKESRAEDEANRKGKNLEHPRLKNSESLENNEPEKYEKSYENLNEKDDNGAENEEKEEPYVEENEFQETNDDSLKVEKEQEFEDNEEVDRLPKKPEEQEERAKGKETIVSNAGRKSSQKDAVEETNGEEERKQFEDDLTSEDPLEPETKDREFQNPSKNSNNHKPQEPEEYDHETLKNDEKAQELEPENLKTKEETERKAIVWKSRNRARSEVQKIDKNDAEEDELEKPLYAGTRLRINSDAQNRPQSEDQRADEIDAKEKKQSNSEDQNVVKDRASNNQLNGTQTTKKLSNSFQVVETKRFHPDEQKEVLDKEPEENEQKDVRREDQNSEMSKPEHPKLPQDDQASDSPIRVLKRNMMIATGKADRSWRGDIEENENPTNKFLGIRNDTLRSDKIKNEDNEEDEPTDVLQREAQPYSNPRNNSGSENQIKTHTGLRQGQRSALFQNDSITTDSNYKNKTDHINGLRPLLSNKSNSSVLGTIGRNSSLLPAKAEGMNSMKSDHDQKFSAENSTLVNSPRSNPAKDTEDFTSIFLTFIQNEHSSTTSQTKSSFTDR